MTEKTVKVKVRKPFRVVHEGEAYSDGAEVTVPESVAVQWERPGRVERVTASSKEKN
ncbi:hypothetical protein [Mycobacterium sp. 23]|uniref:hypothetical protein n=1 Tax=Mycobacterium sp. 23 TaxID=3400424 RepID=UPI003AAC8A69